MVVSDPTAVVRVTPPVDQSGYVDWAAVLAGAVLASAVTLLFTSFGSAIGLTMTSPYPEEGTSSRWFLLAAGLWFLWISVSSVMAGSYLTGRLRRRIDDASEHEVDVRDGAHGLLVWATAVLIGGTLAAVGVSGIAKTATSAAGAVTETVTEAAAAGDGSTASRYLVDTLFRSESAPGPAPAATATVSPSATGTATSSSNDTRTIVPAESREEIMRILAMSAVEGTVSEPDQDYIARVVAAETGLTLEQARARVDTVIAKADEAAATARAVADKARRIGVLLGFLIAASLLVSAAAGYFAAGVGGRHRDEGVIFPGWGYQQR